MPGTPILLHRQWKASGKTRVPPGTGRLKGSCWLLLQTWVLNCREPLYMCHLQSVHHKPCKHGWDPCTGAYLSSAYTVVKGA